MAQNYTIHTFDPGKEPFKDRNGNQWVNVLFEGHLSTPTKWVMRPESVDKWKPGMTVYGRLEQPEGKNYERFYKEQKPDGYGSNQASPAFESKSKYTPNPEQQESIARSVALKAAVDASVAFKVPSLEVTEAGILKTAEVFLAWLQGSSESKFPNLADVGQRVEAEMTGFDMKPKSGYDKFKQQGEALKRDERDEFNDMRSANDEPLPEYPEDL